MKMQHPDHMQINRELGMEIEHPLLNSVILRHIFGYCDARQLRTCRLINKFWKRLSNPYWVKFSSSANISSTPQVEEVVASIGENIWPRYTKYKLSSFTICVGNLALQTLLTHPGEYMTELCVNCSFSDLHSLRTLAYCELTPHIKSLKLIYSLKECTPNSVINQQQGARRLRSQEDYLQFEAEWTAEGFAFMQDLGQSQQAGELGACNWQNLDAYYGKMAQDEMGRNDFCSLLRPTLKRFWMQTEIGNQRDDDRMHVHWVKLLCRFPSLEKLNVHLIPRRERLGDAGHQLEIIRISRAVSLLRGITGSLGSLNEFGFSCPRELTSSHLATPLLRLTRLLFNNLLVNVSNCSPLGINQLAETVNFWGITRLYLASQRDLWTSGRRIPIINSVTKLTLVGGIFRDLNFIEKFPRLSTLSLVGEHWFYALRRHENNNEGAIRWWRHNIREITIRTPIRIPIQSAIKLRALLPRLNSLEMELSGATLAYVCKHWCHLSSLAFSIRNGNTVRMSQLICKLQGLQTLCVSIYSFSRRKCKTNTANDGCKIKDFVQNGVLKLRKLKHLELGVPGHVRLDEKHWIPKRTGSPFQFRLFNCKKWPESTLSSN